MSRHSIRVSGISGQHFRQPVPNVAGRLTKRGRVEMKFRIAGVAACVAGLVVVTGIAAASAAAASDPLVFTGVTGYTWAQKMTIEVTAPTAVTGVTVHLWSGSAEVLTIPSEDFVNLSTELGQTGPNQVMLYEGNGSASGPSPLASLPLGVYTITADAT